MKFKNNRYNPKIILILFVLIFSTFHTSAAYPGIEEDVVNAVERVEPSVVNIKTVWSSYGRSGEGVGSGVIISQSGWILTNAHVIRNAAKIFITLNDGKTFQASEWRADPAEDVAVIKIPVSDLPVAPFGSTSNLKKGQAAIAIGNPWRFTSTVTVGCVSATGRRLEAGGVKLKDLIQTDAAINPGNSGGALVNSKGQVIGINTLVYTGSGPDYAQGLGFAIPIDNSLRIAKELISRKQQSEQRAWLGVIVATVTPQMNLRVRYGVLITGFPPQSPAQEAGLNVGDVIVAINEMPIKNIQDLQSALFKSKPGDVVSIKAVRGGQVLYGKVRLEGIRQ